MSWTTCSSADGLNLYSVVVTNAYGSTNSSMVNLWVNGAPNPVIIPHSQTNVIGSNVTFTVRTSGSPSYGGPPWFNYQWYFNDGTIDGATSATLTITNVQTGNAGNYSVDVERRRRRHDERLRLPDSRAR